MQFTIQFIRFTGDEDGEGSTQAETQDEARPIMKQKYTAKDTMDVDK